MSLTKLADQNGLSASDVLINTHMPPVTNVLPRPYSAPPIGRGVSGVDSQRLNAGLAPRHAKELRYVNELPPPPRSQLDTPFPMQETTRKWKTPKYKKGRCYVGYAKDQDMAAFVCGSGGSENGELYRGNEFGLSSLSENERGEKFVQGLGRDMDIVAKGRLGAAKMQMDRPTVAEGQSLFYPYPSFGNRYYPLYKVYPDTTEYTNDGMPYYHNEDKALTGSGGPGKMIDTSRGVKANTEHGTEEANDMLENLANIEASIDKRVGGDGDVLMVATIILAGITLYILHRS